MSCMVDLESVQTSINSGDCSASDAKVGESEQLQDDGEVPHFALILKVLQSASDMSKRFLVRACLCRA